MRVKWTSWSRTRLRWLKIATYTGKRLKIETEFKERYQQLLDFITIEIIKVEQNKFPR